MSHINELKKEFFDFLSTVPKCRRVYPQEFEWFLARSASALRIETGAITNHQLHSNYIDRHNFSEWVYSQIKPFCDSVGNESLRPIVEKFAIRIIRRMRCDPEAIARTCNEK